MIIKLIRHVQSRSNTDAVKPHEVGDAYISLSELGNHQARSAGMQVGNEFLGQSLRYCSPYTRTRETLAEMFVGAGMAEGLKIYEDARLREVERGYKDDEEEHEIRKIHGWFYYRHDGGEILADCYDRTSAFLESLMRQVARWDNQHVLIVTHGMTIRCFVMRFLHLTVEQFESIENPDNCDIITIAPAPTIKEPVFASGSGRWAVDGLRLRAALIN